MRMPRFTIRCMRVCAPTALNQVYAPIREDAKSNEL